MEIRSVLRGETAPVAAARPARSAEKEKPVARPSADRLELTRQWVENMKEQSARLQNLLSQPAGRKEKKSGGILDMLDGADSRSSELDAEAEQLKVKQRCLEIAARMMRGKKIPPKDEQYLMEHDPEGYKLAIALRKPPKKDEKECKSVLDDEDEKTGRTGETSGSGETAPAESSSGGGESASSGEEE